MVTWVNRRQSTRAERADVPEESRWSRFNEMIVSGFIVVALLIAAVWSVPDSPLKAALTPALVPVARATGLDQSWKMFSPNPPRVVSEIETYVLFTDGEQRMWTFDRDRGIIGSFNYDRWRKLKEQLLAEDVLRPGFAMWVVRQVANPGEVPARVWMIRDTRTTPTPGEVVPIKRERKLLYDWKFAGTR